MPIFNDLISWVAKKLAEMAARKILGWLSPQFFAAVVVVHFILIICHPEGESLFQSMIAVVAREAVEAAAEQVLPGWIAGLVANMIVPSAP